MSTIGLDKLYFAKITEASETGYETYGSPVAAPGVQSADITINVSTVKNYADDGTYEEVREFTDGTITIGAAGLTAAMIADLTGATVDGKNILISADEDSPNLFAVGFRSLRADKTYEYVWLYRVKFSVPQKNYATKGETVSFSNMSIEGSINRRKKPAYNNKHPWRAFADPNTGDATTISGWFSTVYEPTQPAQSGGGGGGGG